MRTWSISKQSTKHIPVEDCQYSKLAECKLIFLNQTANHFTFLTIFFYISNRHEPILEIRTSIVLHLHHHCNQRMQQPPIQVLSKLSLVCWTYQNRMIIFICLCHRQPQSHRIAYLIFSHLDQHQPVSHHQIYLSLQFLQPHNHDSYMRT